MALTERKMNPHANYSPGNPCNAFAENAGVVIAIGMQGESKKVIRPHVHKW